MPPAPGLNGQLCSKVRSWCAIVCVSVHACVSVRVRVCVCECVRVWLQSEPSLSLPLDASQLQASPDRVVGRTKKASR